MEPSTSSPSLTESTSLTKANLAVLLAFDSHNRILIRFQNHSSLTDVSAFARVEPFAESFDLLSSSDSLISSAQKLATAGVSDEIVDVYCCHYREGSEDGKYLSYDQIQSLVQSGELNLSPYLYAALQAVEPQLYHVPYLDQGENEYIYRFRTVKERNRSVYIDSQSESLYQSELCSVIKQARRTKEKSSGEPAVLDFGAVQYVIPSHFGFCLGVQNAIERAYETVASNPDKRVFMLSELIHNPFVNEDLLARGLRYLQTDKGLPLKSDGGIATSPDDPDALWNQLTEDDIVIIPAFGATNKDKVRLIKRGISIRQNDATCMLVEKVWKAARRYAQEGFTVVIHGKSEHEETKATFSNSSSYGPALMLRNKCHAEKLGEILKANGEARRELFEASFAGLYSKGFDPERDLDKIAIVNQTTLLRNETLDIIDYLGEVIAEIHGPDQVATHLWSKGKGDTLCYATQVNQDALHKAVEQKIDAALVVGGKNSSNTFQLYRVCQQKFGEDAHYIQSESNILSLDEIRHYIFPYNVGKPVVASEVVRPFLKSVDRPLRILLTGGASCPDGIIQQVIHRINSFLPADSIRPIDEILKAFDA